MIYTRETIAESMAAIGQTECGRVLRHVLLSVIQEIAPEGSTDGALRAHEARRSFAASLLRQLDPKPDPDGRDANHSLERTPGAIKPAGDSRTKRNAAKR